MSPALPARCDVLIAGGGMVGASLAAALARLPLQVVVVEQVPLAAGGQPSFDERTTALSRSSQRILAGLGLWDALAGEASPIRRIHVSERGRFGTSVIDAAEEGVTALGYVLRNRALGGVLWADLARRTNLNLLVPASAGSVQRGEEELQVRVRHGDTEASIGTRLLVVADGARSRLREQLGIRARQRAYGQVAIVGTVEAAGPILEATAFERFTADGPLALLPAGCRRFVFVLTRKAEAAPGVLALEDDAFRQLLQQEFGLRLGRFGALGPRAGYPLELVVTEDVTAHRVAVVGNAAHGLHPVAGQGYNLGLRDASVLAELLADGIRQAPEGFDAGAPAWLDRYREWRRPDQRKVVAFTDGLVRLFDLPGGFTGRARGLGLLGFDLLPGAKGLLARQTMGLGGRLTRLARGLPL